jgi:hypothetical protein
MLGVVGRDQCRIHLGLSWLRGFREIYVHLYMHECIFVYIYKYVSTLKKSMFESVIHVIICKYYFFEKSLLILHAAVCFMLHPYMYVSLYYAWNLIWDSYVYASLFYASRRYYVASIYINSYICNWIAFSGFRENCIIFFWDREKCICSHVCSVQADRFRV